MYPLILIFPVDSEVANLLSTFWQQVVGMESGKRRHTTDITDFCRRQLVTETLRTFFGKSPTYQPINICKLHLQNQNYAD